MLAFNPVPWLDKHTGTVSAVLTLVLAAITYWYVRLTSGLLHEARTERNDRRERELSEQARLIGGYLRVGGNYAPSRTFGPGYGPGICMLTVTLVNASQLPVRAVRGRAYRTDTGGHFGDFNQVPVLTPGQQDVGMDIPLELSGSMLLRMEFDDDAGVRWLKYESHDQPLRRL